MFDEVPPEDVGTTEECQQYGEEKEAFGVEEPLDTLPMAVDNIAQQEEMQELQGLVEGTVHHEVGFVPLD